MKEKIKLVIWDLDETLWRGTLAEGDDIVVPDEIRKIVDELDSRGILQSIVSKNDFECVMEKLKYFCWEEMFLYPQINWNPKSDNVRYIIDKINISDEAVAFVDDQEFELDEVKYHIPNIVCILSTDVFTILEREDMQPEYITDDAHNRRIMYIADQRRKEDEGKFSGTSEEFLKTLKMSLDLYPAKKKDLIRCAELTVRTHQLNSTGYTYSFKEMLDLINDKRYMLLVASLKDLYGDYGKIGLVLIEKNSNSIWILKLLLTSCRVMSRGIGTIILKMLINYVIEQRITLFAEFVSTDKNRIMAITYSAMGFHRIAEKAGRQIMQSGREYPFELPGYLSINVVF